MNSMIGMAIFSQSSAVARGTADIVHDLVGDEVRCVHYGRERSGRLQDMIAGMQRVLTDLRGLEGIAVLVDIGATEIAAETAVASLSRELRQKIWICDAPIVEGAIVVGAEAAKGATLREVCGRAEALAGSRSTFAS